MKINFLGFKTLFFAAIICASCSKDVASFEEIDGSAVGNTMLRVSTRATPGSNETLSSPINIYLFNSKDKCVAYKQVGTSEENIEFKLTEGLYKVYSLAGADAETYNLPTMENANVGSVVSLKEGKLHKDLLAANNSINLINDQDESLNLEMGRKVLMLSSVTVNDVPTDVSNISVSISPVYENLKLNGEYNGNNGSVTIDLSKTSNSMTWSSSQDLYMLPSIGNPLLKFTFTQSDGSTKSFTYKSEKPLEANYKVAVKVNYIKIKEPTLKCIINGVEWSGEDEWAFDANEKEFATEDKEEPGKPGDSEDTDKLPQAGELYKGCFVLKSESTSSTTTITLISPKQVSGLEFIETDQESVKSAIEAALPSVSVDEISGWRIPTLEEISYLKADLSAFNRKLVSLNFHNFPTTSSYYILNTDGNIRPFSLGSGNVTNLKSNKASLYLAPFATVTFTK